MIVFIVLAIFFSAVGALAAIKYNMFDTQPLEPLQEPPQAPTSPAEPVTTPSMPTHTEHLYNTSKVFLGARLGKDTSIPWMVNCANACTDVLIRAGVPGLPPKGIAGTAALLAFLEKSDSFEEVSAYAPGLVIIAATGSGNGKIRGHVGICGKNQIMSNNSETGLWDTQWTIPRWMDYYTTYGDIPTRYFKWI